MVTKDEVYNFLCCQFKVYDIFHWAKKNAQTVKINLQEMSKVYGFDLPEGHISMFRLDKEYAMTLSEQDVAQPLLVIDLGEGGNVMIDGTHRAYKMWKNGQEEADAYYVSDESVIVKFSSITKKLLKKIKG
jgi:hypothetical protein